ncbi:MAG: hypothetical protein HQK79_03100 [Desulfobacterales bacterium]|nr:hypothetical protein [Desulfobacterales bacterium]
MEWQPQNEFPKEFHNIALSVYKDDPNWMPEQPEEIEYSFSLNNPYFKVCNAWLGVEAGQARLCGFYNPKQTIDDKKVAYFGYWETKDVLEPNKKLFKDFESWSKNKGAEMIYGPINFTTFGANRIRLNHFEAGYFPGEPYNPPYYQKIIQELGYTLVKEYLSYTGNLDGVLENFRSKFINPFEHAKELELKLFQLTPEYWLENIPKLYEYCDIVFSNNFAYSGIAFETFKHYFGKSFANKFCPKTSVLAIDSEDKIAGFIISYPDYSPICRQEYKNFVPQNQLEYKKHFPLLKNPMFISKSGGVHPKYRKAGLFSTINFASAEWAKEDYKFMAGSTMRADNPSKKIAAKIFTRPDDLIRQYGLFIKKI